MSNSTVEKVQSRLAPSFLPATAVLEMTYRCNHRCMFCSCPWEDPEGGLHAARRAFDRRLEGRAPHAGRHGRVQFRLHRRRAAVERGAVRSDRVRRDAHGRAHRERRRRARIAHWPRRSSICSRTARRSIGPCWISANGFDVQLSMSLPGLSTYREHTGGGDPDHILEHVPQGRDGRASRRWPP